MFSKIKFLRRQMRYVRRLGVTANELFCCSEFLVEIIHSHIYSYLNFFNSHKMFYPWFFFFFFYQFHLYSLIMLLFFFFVFFFFSKYDSHDCMLSLISHLNNFLYTFMLQFFKLSSPAKETFRLWVFVILFSLLYPFILFFLSFPLLLYENICLYNDSNMLYESNINSAINFFFIDHLARIRA